MYTHIYALPVRIALSSTRSAAKEIMLARALIANYHVRPARGTDRDVSIYTYIHIYIYICIHIYICHICIYVYTHKYIHTHIHMIVLTSSDAPKMKCEPPEVL